MLSVFQMNAFSMEKKNLKCLLSTTCIESLLLSKVTKEMVYAVYFQACLDGSKQLGSEALSGIPFVMYIFSHNDLSHRRGFEPGFSKQLWNHLHMARTRLNTRNPAVLSGLWIHLHGLSSRLCVDDKLRGATSERHN